MKELEEDILKLKKIKVMKFTEHKLETTFIQLLSEKGYMHSTGVSVPRASVDEALIEDDLRRFLLSRYQAENLTGNEVNSIILTT